MHRHFLTHVAVNEGQLCNSRFEPRSLGLILIHSTIFFKPLLSRVKILCEIGLVVLPSLSSTYRSLEKIAVLVQKQESKLPESLKGQDKAGCTGLDLKVEGPTWSPLCSKRHSDKRRWQKLPNVWFQMGRYLQSIDSICFGSNSLCFLKVKAKNAIRISCRWSSAMFCKMKSISLTWNHTPQPVHCTKRSCNRHFYQNNTQNHNQHQFPSLILLDGYTLSRITWLRTCHPEKKEIIREVLWPRRIQHATSRHGKGLKHPNSSLSPNFCLHRRNISLFFLSDSKFAQNSILA